MQGVTLFATPPRAENGLPGLFLAFFHALHHGRRALLFFGSMLDRNTGNCCRGLFLGFLGRFLFRFFARHLASPLRHRAALMLSQTLHRRVTVPPEARSKYINLLAPWSRGVVRLFLVIYSANSPGDVNLYRSGR